MADLLLKTAAATLLGTYVETKYAPRYIDLSRRNEYGLSPLAGLAPMIMLGTSFWTVIFGFKSVNAARAKSKELANADGEADVEARYGLPNLYAQGTSKNVKAFNCAQRAHQHIFENLNMVVFGSTLAAIHYPICAAISAGVYSMGRIIISNAYAASDGEPSKRYSNALGFSMWYGLLGSIMLGVCSCVRTMSSKKLLW
jgi:MAPEG family